MNAMLVYLKEITTPGVMATVRIPVTASYWLGNPTTASAAKFEKYPTIGA